MYRLPYSLYRLYGQYNQLTDIFGMFINTRNIELVDLSSNNISSISNGTFSSCVHLIYLDLSINPLYIHDGAFSGLSHLRLLHLKHVHQVSFNRETLSGLPGILVDLIIQSPNISQIDPGVFDFTVTRLLSFSGGRLRYLPGGIFGPTKNKFFLTMYIDDMPLQDISPRTFDGIGYIFTLKIRHCELKHLPEGLFDNTRIVTQLDLSRNRLEDLPNNFLKSSPTIVILYLFGNNLKHLSPGVFAGLEHLRSLLLFHNRLTEIPTITHLPKLENVYLFDNNISYVGKTSLKTLGHTITKLHMYYNPITKIEDDAFHWLANGGNVFISTEYLHQWPKYASNITISSVGTDVDDVKWTVGVYVKRVLSQSGFNCSRNDDSYWECVPCKVGYYTATYVGPEGQCIKCPAGGFYQDKIGQLAEDGEDLGCERCNPGTFVPLEDYPGTKAADCQVCPTGTDKTNPAGFRACPCLDGYFRTDRFGTCKQCPEEGVDCSFEYQKLKQGYWWTWNFDGNDTAGYIEMLKYKDFVNNILISNDGYDKNTTSFNGKIPMPFKCPQGIDACPVHGDNISIINASCGDGYEGWLCSRCSKGYYPWFEYCFECPSWWRLALELVIVALVVVAVVGFAIWNYRRKRGRPTRSPLDTFIGSFKIVLAYYQIAGAILTSMHDIQWPKEVSQLAGIFKYLELNIFKLLAKPRCFTDALQLNIYEEFVVGMSFCAVVIILSCMIYVCLKYRFRHAVIPEKYYLPVIALVVVFLFITYQSVCQVIMGLMPPACHTFCLVANGTRCTYSVTKLRSDYGINCNSPKHLHFQMGAYICLIYVVGFPISMLLVIKDPKTVFGIIRNIFLNKRKIIMIMKNARVRLRQWKTVLTLKKLRKERPC
ncbi:uncharacterized protein [Amphiura filiformis]|uniref:uncharacterized protein n=1 Tax=Amphiura filiformis TaxID=82378 RepID=UPI003B2273CC